MIVWWQCSAVRSAVGVCLFRTFSVDRHRQGWRWKMEVHVILLLWCVTLSSDRLIMPSVVSCTNNYSLSHTQMVSTNINHKFCFQQYLICTQTLSFAQKHMLKKWIPLTYMAVKWLMCKSNWLFYLLSVSVMASRGPLRDVVKEREKPKPTKTGLICFLDPPIKSWTHYQGPIQTAHTL